MLYLQIVELYLEQVSLIYIMIIFKHLFIKMYVDFLYAAHVTRCMEGRADSIANRAS
jgi:hypothetical protein